MDEKQLFLWLVDMDFSSLHSSKRHKLRKS